MRRVSICGAVFVFLNEGEELTKDAFYTSFYLPDQRYVIRPRHEGWDVRYLDITGGTREWLPVAGKTFPDESAAWINAFEHWEKMSRSALVNIWRN